MLPILYPDFSFRGFHHSEHLGVSRILRLGPSAVSLSLWYCPLWNYSHVPPSGLLLILNTILLSLKFFPSFPKTYLSWPATASRTDGTGFPLGVLSTTPFFLSPDFPPDRIFSSYHPFFCPTDCFPLKDMSPGDLLSFFPVHGSPGLFPFQSLIIRNLPMPASSLIS